MAGVKKINMNVMILEARINLSTLPIQKHGKSYVGTTQIFLGYKF
jgi:hypothetical protein